MKKRILIPTMVVTHLLCLVLGYGFGANRTVAVEEPVETTVPAKATTEAVAEPTAIPEITEVTIPTEGITLPAEATEETVEGNKTQDVPKYTPAATTPSATQPPATEPPVSEPSSSEIQPEIPAESIPSNNSGELGNDDMPLV